MIYRICVNILHEGIRLICKLTGYHGTTKENAENILNSGYKLSQKSNLWLGDGIYFFIEDIFSFKWCLSLHKNKIDKYNKEDIIDKMAILKSEVQIEEERLLDFTLLSGQILFDKAYKRMKESSLKFKEKLNNGKNVERLVINYMFNEMNYIKKYDAIKQMYRLDRDNYKGILHESVRGIPQYQICIKNVNIITKSECIDFKYKYDEYIKTWDFLSNATGLIKLYTSSKSVNNNNKVYVYEYDLGDVYD